MLNYETSRLYCRLHTSLIGVYHDLTDFMKKVLITGGTGFIGSNFVYKFLELGDDVHLIVRPESNFERINSIKDKLGLHYIDLFNFAETENFIAELKPDVILHFAAYGTRQGKQQDAKLTVDTNLLGTVNLVNAASKIKFDCFINAGSSSEYGEKNHPIAEEDLPEPNNLYGVTKVAATMYCQFLAKKMDLPIVTMRLFSPYGYFEEKGRLMPNIVTAGLRGEKFTAPSPSPTRDFVFIEDVINAYTKAIANINGIKGHILNIASGKQYSIAEVVDVVEKILGRKLEVEYGSIEVKQHEPKMWVADISKAKKLLNWSPINSLEDGLRKYIVWVRKNQETPEI